MRRYALVLGFMVISLIPANAAISACGSACNGEVVQRDKTATSTYDLKINVNGERGPGAQYCHVNGAFETFASCVVGTRYPNCAAQV